MEDALRNVPGVAMSHGDGQRDQVVIRGFTAIADQFVDGVRDDALYFRDLADIERVEVLKGPAAVLYGRGSSGGLINRVTKKPKFSETSGEASLGLGNFDYRRATADFISNHNHDTGSSADALYAYPARDVNKIAYRTPSLGGATFEAGWAQHEQPSGTGGKNSLDLAANYEIGKLGLGAGYSKLGDQNQFAVRASYSTGPFVMGAYVQRDKNVFIANGGNRTNLRLSAAYIMGVSEFHVNVGRAGNYSNVSNSAATQYTLGYNYNLSKRTKIYTYYTRINNSQAATYGVSAPGNDFSSFAVGVRHNF